MGKSIVFYADSALTTQLAVLPLGTATVHLRSSAILATIGTDMYAYYTAHPYRSIVIDTIDVGYATVTGTGSSLTIYGDNFSFVNISCTSGVPYSIPDAVFCNSVNIKGSGSCTEKWAAVTFVLNAITWICIGSWNAALTTFTPHFCVSENAIGKKSLMPKGGPDTPPGAGADADAGYGDYDFDSPQGLGSTMPTGPSLPVSDSGRGLHAYTMDAAAYQVLGDALWGIGDSGSSVAFADMWQKWQNYKFNPTAGIISCIRLPDMFTPSRASLTDSNIKLSGTWAVKGGQFASITGCKVADVSPIAQTVLSVDIPETYGSWLDYDGGLEITLDLPFCGRMQIDPSACVNGGIDVEYRCDPCNGNVAAFVFCRDRWGNNQLYNVAYGNCAFQVPLTGHDDGQVQMLGSFVGSAAALAGAAASPVMAAGAAVGAVSSMLMRREITQTVGAPSGSVAYVGNVAPTLIISKAHPIKSPGTIYDDTEGRPCEYGGSIGDYTGYAVFHNVDVEIAGASAEECAEIERLLESGVIL